MKRYKTRPINKIKLPEKFILSADDESYYRSISDWYINLEFVQSDRYYANIGFCLSDIQKVNLKATTPYGGIEPVPFKENIMKGNSI